MTRLPKFRSAKRGSVQVLAAIVAAGLASCSAVPSDGPTSGAVHLKANVAVEPAAPDVNYVTVALSPTVISTLTSQEATPRFSRLLTAAGRANVQVNVGDRLNITVFEAKEGGLFVPLQAGARPGNFVVLPQVEVPESGVIGVPYAGTIHVAGRSIQSIQGDIVSRLRERAIEPQVVVAVAERLSNHVSILGDVTAPTRVPINPSGLRVLDAIARAGGAKFPAYETVVTVQRGPRVETASLSMITRIPQENIQLRSGDVVTVTRAPRVFLAFGATVTPQAANQIGRRLAFDDANMTLAEGVAKAGGLSDVRADAKEVYLFRMESRAALAQLGVDLSLYAGQFVPTVYHVNLMEPGGYFLAGQFYMRDKDALFVAPHPIADLAKFIGLFTGAGALAQNASVAARGF